jgi:hypothetical protein
MSLDDVFWRSNEREPPPGKAAAPFTTARMSEGILREETNITDQLVRYLAEAIMPVDLTFTCAAINRAA